jgi:hypothetical protein
MAFTVTWDWPADGEGATRSVTWDRGHLSGDEVLVAMLRGLADGEMATLPTRTGNGRPGRRSDPLADEASARVFLAKALGQASFGEG